jgi:hypothetical protein
LDTDDCRTIQPDIYYSTSIYIAASANAAAAPPTTHCALPVTIAAPAVLTLELEVLEALAELPVELEAVFSGAELPLLVADELASDAAVVDAEVEATVLVELAAAPASATIVTTWAPSPTPPSVKDVDMTVSGLSESNPPCTVLLHVPLSDVMAHATSRDPPGSPESPG